MYPLMIEGATLRALVVGGGAVALRKSRALLETGARVRVVAPVIQQELRSLEGLHLSLVEREYETDDIDDAMLVVAATASRDVNARVAVDARARGRLVNVADAPAEGNCVTPAVHRAGDLVIAVTAGGLPSAAARVRDSIAAHYSDSYANAISELGEMRSSLLASGRRARWAEVAEAMLGADFCQVVEGGEFGTRVSAWR